MKIYGLKNCDTCRKALKSIEKSTLIDIRTSGMPEGLLEAAYAQFGAKLVNTRSATWRGLSEQDRASEPLALLREHPALMKRPLIDRDGELFLGWDQNVQAALGGS
ncbi:MULTISPECIES: arsenate reductase family protein [unclassified Leisingera]|uniref:arsenate reductase family protein n=1 Tax=unclassified Leisingera TaxID=2614906 RepID=UPI00101041C3|nr:MULTISPECIES: ArsC/Spx/MgsR family protein [unclassified Leisingera]MBQ4827587.1 arsenate reductase [Leisingera sp. HS039]QAX30048.1 arsenate reductase [Leisingera sp. NJS204]QBR36770.1 arsenate reductase [Leisingera sp. NJS201]